MAVERVIAMAAVIAVAGLVLVIGCVIDDNWWSMLNAACYLIAVVGWLLSQQCAGAQAGAFESQKADSSYAYIAGLFMAIGWWCLFDAAVYNSCQTNDSNRCDLSDEARNGCLGHVPPLTPKKLSFAMYLPGMFATLAVAMTNCFNYNAYTEPHSISMNNCWLFVSYTILFCCTFTNAWILFDYWLADDSCTTWPGVASLLQTICMLISAVVFFFGSGGVSGRRESPDSQGICGGSLLEKWGCAFAACGFFSSFGCSLVMWRMNLIQSSFYTSNLAGLVLCGAVLFEVKEGAITRTSTRHQPLQGSA